MSKYNHVNPICIAHILSSKHNKYYEKRDRFLSNHKLMDKSLNTDIAPTHSYLQLIYPPLTEQDKYTCTEFLSCYKAFATCKGWVEPEVNDRLQFYLRDNALGAYKIIHEYFAHQHQKAYPSFEFLCSHFVMLADRPRTEMESTLRNCFCTYCRTLLAYDKFESSAVTKYYYPPQPNPDDTLPSSQLSKSGRSGIIVRKGKKSKWDFKHLFSSRTPTPTRKRSKEFISADDSSSTASSVESSSQV